MPDLGILGTNVLGAHMSKSERLSHIIQVYLAGELELDTAVAEVTNVYVERGWHFVLVEAECQPQYRERMRVLAARIHAEVLSPPETQQPSRRL